MSSGSHYPPALISVKERPAKRWIWTFSGIVFLAVVVLNRVQIPTSGNWDVHVFAKVNAVLNTLVSILLLAGLVAALKRNFTVHLGIMASAMALSILFLTSYILHHLFAGETKFGGDGAIRVCYYLLLGTHIILAATSLPFILLTAYHGLTAHYGEHRKLARKVWPIWFFVSVSGVVVYLMISPYY